MTKPKQEEGSFVPFLEVGAITHMSLKNSMDGKEKDEVVAALQGMYDEEKGRNVGWRIMKKVYGDKENGVENPEQ